jgi:hypothetical protein
VVFGALVAVTLELAGVPALPVAVGMYIPLGSTTPIFAGGLVRWLAEKVRGKPASEAESETSPGVLLASGYIAGGTLCGLVVTFFVFLPDWFRGGLNVGSHLFGEADPGTGKVAWEPEAVRGAKVAAVVLFGVLAAVLFWIGSRRDTRT